MTGADNARRWLDAREPGPPAELRERMLAALAEVAASTPVPAVLAEAGLTCFRAALSAVHAGTSQRTGAGLTPTALDLLAGDALLTYACEAAAEEGSEALAALAREYGAARLARLLDLEGNGEPDRP